MPPFIERPASSAPQAKQLKPPLRSALPARLLKLPPRGFPLSGLPNASIRTILPAALLIFAAARAQEAESEDPEFGQVMRDVGSQAVRGYAKPFPTWIGTGMNSGWYNTSKTLSFLGQPVGFALAKVNLPIVMLDKSMQTFDFQGEIPLRPMIVNFLEQQNAVAATNVTELMAAMEGYSQTVRNNPGIRFEDVITVQVDDIPTVTGPTTPPSVRMDSLLANAGADTTLHTLLILQDWNSSPQGLVAPVPLDEEIQLPFRGIEEFDGPAPSFPGIGAEISFAQIPVIKNATVGIRFFPTYQFGDYGSVGQLGLKFQHEFTEFIPAFSSLPFLHTSWYYAFNRLSLDAAGYGSLAMNNSVAMLNASLDAKFFAGAGAYFGLGWEQSSVDISIDESPEFNLPAFSVTIPGENGFRTQVGVRLSLLLFDFYADANFGSVTSYSLGVALGLNGL